MNEIEPWRVSRPLKAKVELIDTRLPAPPDPDPNTDPAPEIWLPDPAAVQAQESRASQRYPAVGDGGRSWLGWHEGSHFRQTPAWILNISAGGCLIAADAPAPSDRSLWLRLDNAAVPDWAEVRVIDHQRTNAGLLATRLVFRGTCPYDMMKAVAFGPSHQPRRPEPSRSWKSNSW